MATRLKPSRINVDNTPRVGDGAAYKTDNDFHRSMGGGDMSYTDFERETLTGNSLTIENISNNVTPSSDFTVTAGTLKPGIEYILRVNTGNTPYTMTLGTGVTNPNGYDTTLKPNTVNQFKFIATSSSQLELEGVIVNDATLTITQNGTSAGTFSANASNNTTIALTDTKYTATDFDIKDLTDSTSLRTTWSGKQDAFFTSGSTAPANPSEGDAWYDTTNDVLKSYNGSSWDVVGSDASDINTKTFYLSSTSDLTTAQAAYDWYLAGKNPILTVGNDKRSFIMAYGDGTASLGFVSADIDVDHNYGLYGSADHLAGYRILINSGIVYSVISADLYGGNYLETDYNYSTPYTPQYDGSPATKKYVDDKSAYVGSSAPSNPTEGQLWYDTTNDVLKTYDGTNWNECGGGSGDVVVSSDADNVLTTGAGLWVGDENDLPATPDSNTLYFTY